MILTIIVNFFTASDFVGLLTRKAMLPLIVFSVLFGFATNMAGGSETLVAKWLSSMTDVMMKFIKIITFCVSSPIFVAFSPCAADSVPIAAAAAACAPAFTPVATFEMLLPAFERSKTELSAETICSFSAISASSTCARRAAMSSS